MNSTQCCQSSLSLGRALLLWKAVMEPVGSFQSHCEGHTHIARGPWTWTWLWRAFSITHSRTHSWIHQMHVLSTASVWVWVKALLVRWLEQRHAWSARWSPCRHVVTQVSWHLRSPHGLSHRHPSPVVKHRQCALGSWKEVGSSAVSLESAPPPGADWLWAQCWCPPCPVHPGHDWSPDAPSVVVCGGGAFGRGLGRGDVGRVLRRDWRPCKKRKRAGGCPPAGRAPYQGRDPDANLHTDFSPPGPWGTSVSWWGPPVHVVFLEPSRQALRPWPCGKEGLRRKSSGASR